MSDGGFIGTAASYAWATFVYLVASRFVIGLAPLASVLAQGLLQPGRVLHDGPPSWPGALLLGSATSPRASAIAPRVTLLASRGAAPGALVAFLVGAHLLTPYYFILIGPLLGKDVLLSHLIGTVLCFALVARLWRPAAVAPAGHGVSARDETLARVALLELTGIGPHLVLGVVLGGIIAAWGLSPTHVELATLLGGGLAAQVGSAVAGTALGALTCLPPVANLLVATYLWKTGLAHAGLVSFMLASAATVQRRRLYASVLGEAAARKLSWALLIAAPLAGLGTAVVFRVLGLTIHYRLVPEQLL